MCRRRNVRWHHQELSRQPMELVAGPCSLRCLRKNRYLKKELVQVQA